MLPLKSLMLPPPHTYAIDAAITLYCISAITPYMPPPDGCQLITPFADGLTLIFRHCHYYCFAAAAIITNIDVYLHYFATLLIRLLITLRILYRALLTLITHWLDYAADYIYLRQAEPFTLMPLPLPWRHYADITPFHAFHEAAAFFSAFTYFRHYVAISLMPLDIIDITLRHIRRLLFLH